MPINNNDLNVPPLEAPKQFPRPQLPQDAVSGKSLVQAGRLIRVKQARDTFRVDGSNTCAAVLDTGLRVTHVDFEGRVPDQRNFTDDNRGDAGDASDGQGHGTNVAGIIAANRIHVGIAGGASIVPVKVLGNAGGGSFEGIAAGLQWVLSNRVRLGITAVCMSLGDGGNYRDDGPFGAATALKPIRELTQAIRDLERDRIAVVIASGNDFFPHGSAQGMSYPAIVKESISVGAVYDAREGAFSYSSGARTTESGPDRITPFSQRLHRKIAPETFIDVFAPGAPITSSGIETDEGESTQQGTSQATPVTVGLVLLLQQFWRRETGELPTVEQIRNWLELGGIRINDGDDEADNVANTGLDFTRVDAFGALEAAVREMQRNLL